VQGKGERDREELGKDAQPPFCPSQYPRGLNR
jgi:hypothetical protein